MEVRNQKDGKKPDDSEDAGTKERGNHWHHGVAYSTDGVGQAVHHTAKIICGKNYPAADHSCIYYFRTPCVNAYELAAEKQEDLEAVVVELERYEYDGAPAYHVYFDDCGIVVYNKNNLILWDIAFSEDDDEDYIKRIYRLVLYNFSSKRVKRVYPDCC